ncbi:hypothetical protein ABT299_22825 [Spirillospora sp. NPDC000708]
MKIGIGRGAVLATAASVLLAGCGDSGGGEKKPEMTGQKVETQSSAPAQAGASATGCIGGGVGAENAQPLVAPINVKLQRFAGGTVEVAVVGLLVKDKFAILTMRIKPTLPQGTGEKASPYELNNSAPLAPELIDTVNAERYVVVKDSDERQVQDDDVSIYVGNGQCAAPTYTFAAPPANVRSLDVHYGQWPFFSNVPVQR